MVANMKQILITFLMAIFSTGCSLFGAGNEEQPKYQVVMKQEAYEIRKYDSYIVAQTSISGDFKEAQSKGFRILAGYIFGKNKSKSKISMTSPVVQEKELESEKISMTSPVTLTPNDNAWTMTFSMPSKYTLSDLPVPDDERVKLSTIESRFVAALTFSGFWSEAKNDLKGKELEEWLTNYKEYEMISKPMFAGYNPPWTLPFLRRNEILIELKKRD